MKLILIKWTVRLFLLTCLGITCYVIAHYFEIPDNYAKGMMLFSWLIVIVFNALGKLDEVFNGL